MKLRNASTTAAVFDTKMIPPLAIYASSKFYLIA
jgi:hypothetical protein